MNQPYATLMLASALREMFGVQLYKNNARALLSRILRILNLDWLQHARSVRGVYEWVWVRALDASKSQRACIILSKFTRKSKYAVIYNRGVISFSGKILKVIKNPEKWRKIRLKHTKSGWKSIKLRKFWSQKILKSGKILINHTPAIINIHQWIKEMMTNEQQTCA